MQNAPRDRDELIQNWEKKAKKVYSESIKIMREGFHGLEVMAGRTMEITRIKLANQKSLQSIRMLFTELGQRVFDMLRNPENGSLKITPDISLFIDQIRKLQSSIEENLERLRDVTIVGKKEGKKHKPAASKKAARKQPTRKRES